MALYEYRCRTCEERFEVERPMTAVVTSTPCPDGHLDTVKVLSSFATMGAPAASRVSAGGGGCCGGGCGCH